MEPMTPIHRLYDPDEVHPTERIRKSAERRRRERRRQSESTSNDPFEIDTFERSDGDAEPA